MTGRPRPAAERPGLPPRPGFPTRTAAERLDELTLNDPAAADVVALGEALADMIAERVQLVAVSAIPAELGELLHPGSVQNVKLYASNPAHELVMRIKSSEACLDVEFWVNCDHRAASFSFPYRR